MLLTEAMLQPLWMRAERKVAEARQRFRRLPEGCPAREEEGSIPAMRWELDGEVKGCKEEPYADRGVLPVWAGRAQVAFHPELLSDVGRTEMEGIRREAVEETLKERRTLPLGSMDGRIGGGWGE